MSFTTFICLLTRYACYIQQRIRDDQEFIDSGDSVKPVWRVMYDMITLDVFVPRMRAITLYSTAIGLDIYLITFAIWRLYVR